MKTFLEDSLESSILSCGEELWSAKGEGDSNALIFPKRKKQIKKDKTKGNHLLKVHENKKLGKSGIKMQKNLEEDKKKSLLWSKSMEDLEKYKVQEDVYSLMWSSSNIGQVETVRGRRRREVQYSIAGISLTQKNQLLKTSVNPRCEIETNSDINCINAMSPEIESLPQVRCDVPEFSEPSKELVKKSVLCIDGKAGNVSGVKEVAQTSLHSADKYDGRSKIQDLEIKKPKYHTSTGNLVKCTIPRVLTASRVVHIKRSKEVMKTRNDLPIIMMEQEIMEAVNENLSVIICGETGCGKTTQVPQFLYEAGFGLQESSDRNGIIGVTQPRRVAVFATARRVAEELGVNLGKEVGFQVQHIKNISKNCSIKFMTDGILLREVQSDFLLKKYSVLILDEAHERSLNTDILIGMLSRVVQERKKIYEQQQGKEIKSKAKIYPLRLILMSATLRVEDFVSNTKIFPSPPPVIEVPTRQYPITTHFSKRTETVYYIGQAYKKVMAIHKKLPPGGILVFVTGAREVEYLCQQLIKASVDIVAANNRRGVNRESDPVPVEDPMKKLDMEMINDDKDAIEDYVRKETFNEDDDDDDGFNGNYQFSNDSESSDSELEEIDDENIAQNIAKDGNLSGKRSTASTGPNKNKIATPVPILNQFAGPMRVLPLYSMLGPEKQHRVFEKINGKERLVVVATNVAEASLTIPGIKYVVDTGREKVKKYDPSNGMESFHVSWISKASADQRAGRAGRTSPGHCYRLYSSAVFNDKFVDFSSPEILKRPLNDIVLRLISMGIKVSSFPFPTKPNKDSLVDAYLCLKALEALDINGTLTPLGKAMSKFPMSPRQSRMLLTVIHTLRNNSKKKRANLTLAYAVATASALTLSNPSVTRFDEISKNADEEYKSRKKKKKEAFQNFRAKFSNPTSDALSVAYALQCFEISENPCDFCDEYMLHFKTMEEMSKLRKQLLDIVFEQSIKNDNADFVWENGNIKDVERAWRVVTEKSPLRPNEEELLRQAICAGWADRVGKKTRNVPSEKKEQETCQIHRVRERRVNATCYQASVVKEKVFLHKRSSVSESTPEFLVYSELVLDTESGIPYIHGATRVKPEWLIKYAASSCDFKPPKDPKPCYDLFQDRVLSWVDVTFRPHAWELPLHRIPIEDNLERVKAFAFCLLDGQILRSLKSDLKKLMRDQPSIILRPESSARVGNLLNKLNKRSRIIDSRAKLKEVWDESPRELYVEIWDWFQEGYYGQFEELWSKMQKEVKMDPIELFPQKAKKRKRG